MKRVLVTGASGFIGRNALQPLIDRGYDVHASFTDAALETEKVQWHQVNLMEHAAVEKLCADLQPTHLLHFAWYAVPGLYWTSPENEKWKHATMGLVRAFRDRGGIRAVLAGTCAEYDWTITQALLKETGSQIAPSTAYGKAKHETHELASRFARESDLSLAWGRIFFLYGPHEARMRLVPYVIDSLLSHEIALCSSGEQVRDFLHVSDVADAFVSLLDASAEGAVNIASGNAVQLKDIIYTIADMLDGRDLIQLGARESAPGEPARLVADISRLRDEVHWQPQIALRDGLEKTIDWWRSQRA